MKVALLLALALASCQRGTDSLAREHFDNRAACQLTADLLGPAQCIYGGQVYLCLRISDDGETGVQCAVIGTRVHPEAP